MVETESNRPGVKGSAAFHDYERVLAKYLAHSVRDCRNDNDIEAAAPERRSGAGACTDMAFRLAVAIRFSTEPGGP